MLKVLEPGFFTTIQDNGRFQYRDIGVPVSGAMDGYSSQFANVILGNTSDMAVLEITMVGPKLQFLKPTFIVISGAQMQPKLNGKRIEHNMMVQVRPNDILSFGKLESGFRAYLAIKGGFKTEVVLGSRSMYVPVTDKDRVKAGDILNYKPFEFKISAKNAALNYRTSVIGSNELQVFKGPEYGLLNSNIKEKLENISFKVSSLNNRMAYQMESVLINDLDTILTGPVLPGTVQLTPSGKLIILMRDCQTTGGYPRVLQLTHSSINVLSQKFSGNDIKFRLGE
ncbi:5-oxoprolinase subunit C family protein [Winogradskyella aurantia]|uniref:Allophanate hydrolase n=1 Tax=Winogradskyella aurantia TaxID=1915063 RepID=A0A265UXD1_9FLAO|nr:biotin-dependent carboxyltransferase family protein [Winogradskyella aurantia]OZV69961.1 allophanate hydrolase [Winogradskyella aurantia]